MNSWISSLSNFFFVTAKLTTTFSQKPSLFPGKKIKFIREFSSLLACISTCNSFFTALMRVVKTGLQLYFCSVFVFCKHFFPNSFYDSVADNEKKCVPFANFYFYFLF